MSLSKSERGMMERRLLPAGEQVARVLPVTFGWEWDDCLGLHGLWMRFSGEPPLSRPQRLSVDAICYEHALHADLDKDWSAYDAWERGRVQLSSDGRPDDIDVEQRAPNLWRTCVLEELAVAVRSLYPLGAAELQRVAESLRPKETS